MTILYLIPKKCGFYRWSWLILFDELVLEKIFHRFGLNESLWAFFSFFACKISVYVGFHACSKGENKCVCLSVTFAGTRLVQCHSSPHSLPLSCPAMNPSACPAANCKPDTTGDFCGLMNNPLIDALFYLIYFYKSFIGCSWISALNHLLMVSHQDVFEKEYAQATSSPFYIPLSALGERRGTP